MEDLLRITADGPYCPAGDFHLDPWHPVPRAVVTHAHSDHARRGCGHYLAAAEGGPLLRTRLGAEARLETEPYGTPRTVGRVRVSFHPAGHLLGSAQVRLEKDGRVAVFSGDYKRQPDPTCADFEPVRCHLFVTESTFGLPIYRWPNPDEVIASLHAWWRENKEAGRPSVVFVYAVGKAQRVLAALDPSIGPILTHGAMDAPVAAYRASGVSLPETRPAVEVSRAEGRGALVLAPPSARGTPWLRRFPDHRSAFVSGWMLLRGTRRRRAVDRGFVLSDHADWPGLLDTIAETEAEQVWAMHGQTGPLVRWLREHGQDAATLETRYGGDTEETASGEGVGPPTANPG